MKNHIAQVSVFRQMNHFGYFRKKFTKWKINLGCHALLQGIFPTQGSNLCLSCLLNWPLGSLPLAPPGKPNPVDSYNVIIKNGHEWKILEKKGIWLKIFFLFLKIRLCELLKKMPPWSGNSFGFIMQWQKGKHTPWRLGGVIPIENVRKIYNRIWVCVMWFGWQFIKGKLSSELDAVGELGVLINLIWKKGWLQ